MIEVLVLLAIVGAGVYWFFIREKEEVVSEEPVEPSDPSETLPDPAEPVIPEDDYR